MVDRPRFAIEVHANPPKNLCHLTCVTICGYIARRILAAARVALGPLRCFCSAKRCKSKIIRSDNGYIDKKFWHIIKSLIICIGLILATQKSKISPSSLELELEVQHVVIYSTVSFDPWRHSESFIWSTDPDLPLKFTLIRQRIFVTSLVSQFVDILPDAFWPPRA